MVCVYLGCGGVYMFVYIWCACSYVCGRGGMWVCVYIASIYSSYGACMCGMSVYIECGFVYIYMVCACWMWMCVYGVYVWCE